MKQPLLLFHVLVLFPALELIAAGPPPDKDADPVIQGVYNKFAAMKNISKRHVCPEGKHQSGDNCCDHCEPGYIKEKDCTASSKTICKNCVEGKEYTEDYNYLSKCQRCSSCDAAHANLGWIAAIIVPLILLPILFIIWKYWYKKDRMPRTRSQDEQETAELKPSIYQDIDLTTHISDIAEEMTLEQVMKFVRKRGLSNPTIERIKLDNIHDASEMKIKLLETWFQENGIKGAYGTLISSLKDLKQYTLAQNIVQKIDLHIQNNANVPVYQNMASLEESCHR
ncbi:tumor necrosis factor receptor superfamily member 6 isoform X2 [Sphaerodactylus townsendi]|uniref:tumor necrosis factor receptor superfamily member 6 isoform X2 n=1 Tax=Sphaerodactylus townsendi TaxID=933632 RepID=UPI0020267F6E|nr:tumor necrosis factor receptor superfamily member 6 isoform X2 [Sphaerodactylus townsendi]